MNKEKRSVAFVLDGNFTAGEGVASYAETLGEYYRSLGHEVNYLVGKSDSVDPHVYSLGHPISVPFNGNRIDIPLPIPLGRKRIDEVFQKVNPDIVHVQMPYSPFFGARFIQQAKPEAGIVGTFHIAPESMRVRVGAHLLGIANRTSQQKFDQIMSVSPAAQAFAASAFGITSEVLPCPIDVGHYSKGRKSSEYGDDDKTNVVFMGRLVERKGCQYLLKAVAGLDASVQAKTRVLIAGSGPLLSKLQSQTKNSGLEQVVKFLGFVEDERKPNLLASADIAVFPSTGGESFGIVLLEAMAAQAGVVIGGDNDGYRKVLDDPSALFNPKNGGVFTERLRSLILSPEKRQALHTSQQELVKQYDISVIGPRMLAIYSAVLERKNAA